MIQIDQNSFVAIPDGGFAGTALTTSDSAVVGLALDNDGTDDDGATVRFTLSDGREGGESVAVSGQSQAWVPWNIGPLQAGGYTCQATVTGGDGTQLGQDEIHFQVVVDAGDTQRDDAGGPPSQHDPNDYRLEIRQIAMQTEGGSLVHAEDEAFATERVFYYAEVVNDSGQFLGPIEVHFLIDGEPIGWGGMSHQGIADGESFWAEGYTDTLTVGVHTVAIEVESLEPSLFVGDQQQYELTVLQPRSRGSVDQGDEDELAGWTLRNLNLFVKDFEGRGVDGGIYVEISDGEHRVAYRGEVEDGAVSIEESVWAPQSEGTLILTINTDSGRPLTGGGTFDDGTDAITKTYVQSKRIETLTFQTEEQWEAMVGATVSGGVELKVFSFGAEITGEYHWGETITRGVEYEIWFPQSIVEDEERASARQR